MIYFDHNATTPLDERVMEVMLPYLHSFYGNPSSLYKMGRISRSAIDTAREHIATLIDATPAQIIFTSGGTEANNLVLNTLPANSKIAVSTIEHPSIMTPAIQQKSASLISVDTNGIISDTVIVELLKKSSLPPLISIMLANNETGVIQNIAGFTELLKDKKIAIHTDAIQAIGKMPVSFRQLGVNFMSLSSHKIYGPKGCGALVIDKQVESVPLFIGGGQENGWRAGTENVAAIVGFGKAAELAMQELEQRIEYLLTLRKKLEQKLKTINGLVIFSEQVERLANTIQFGIEGIDGEMLLMQLDQKNIAVSSGSACTAGGGKASTVLTAMGVDYLLAKSAIRVSLGLANTEAEINQFVQLLKSFVLKKG